MKTKLLITVLMFGLGLTLNSSANTGHTNKSKSSSSAVKDDTTPGNARNYGNKATETHPAGPSVLDQSTGSAQDVEVTRRIREELGKTDLSTAAKNIEVITLNNNITLRGTVSSQAEKEKIYDTAQNAAGSRNISNEITVDTSKKY